MYKKLKNEGFTIIEVLIVLAIAGLILLVVFLAVPALQRNGRNTAIRTDVQNVLGGLSEYMSANNGSMPTTITASSGTVTYGAGNTTNARIQGSTAISVITAAPTTTPAANTIQVRLGATCAGVTNSRAAAAYYSIETSTGNTQQCQDS